MPRRYCDYSDVFSFWNAVSSLGSIVTIFSVILFVYLIWESFSSSRLLTFSFNYASCGEFYFEFPFPLHSNMSSIKISGCVN